LLSHIRDWYIRQIIQFNRFFLFVIHHKLQYIGYYIATDHNQAAFFGIGDRMADGITLIWYNRHFLIRKLAEIKVKMEDANDEMKQELSERKQELNKWQNEMSAKMKNMNAEAKKDWANFKKETAAWLDDIEKDLEG